MKNQPKSRRGHGSRGPGAVAQASTLANPLDQGGAREPEQSAAKFMVYWMGIPFALLILLVVYRVYFIGIQ